MSSSADAFPFSLLLYFDDHIHEEDAAKSQNGKQCQRVDPGQEVSRQRREQGADGLGDVGGVLLDPARAGHLDDVVQGGRGRQVGGRELREQAGDGADHQPAPDWTKKEKGESNLRKKNIIQKLRLMM